MRFHLLVVAALCLQSSCASDADFISELIKLEGELERAKQVDHPAIEKPVADEEIEDGEQTTVPFPVEDIELPEKRSKKSSNYNSGVCDDIKDNSPYKIICYMVTVGQSAPGYEGLAGVSHKGYSPPIGSYGGGSVYGGPVQGYGTHSVPSAPYVPSSGGYGSSSSGYSGLTGGHSVSSPGTFQGYSGPIASVAHGLPGISSGSSYGAPIGPVSGGSSSYGQVALGSSSGYGNPSASSGTSFGNGAAPGYSSSYGTQGAYGMQGALGQGHSLINVPAHHGIISSSSHYKSMNADDDSIAEASDDTMAKEVPSHGSEDMERSAYYPKIYPAVPSLPNILPIHIPNYLKAPALPHLHYSKPCHASASSSETPIYLKCLQSQSAPAHKSPILVQSYGPVAHELNNNKYYGQVMLAPHLPQETLSYGSYGLGVPASSQSLSYGHLLESSYHGNSLPAPYYGQSHGGYSYRKAEMTHQENKDHPTLAQAREQQQAINQHQSRNQQIHNTPSNIHQDPQMANLKAMTMDHSQTQNGPQLANHRQQIVQQSGVHTIPEHLVAGINHGTQNSFNINKPLGGQQQKSSQMGWDRSMSGGNQFMRLSNAESVSMPRFVLVNQGPRMSTDQMLNNPQRAAMDQGLTGQVITLTPQQMMQLNQRNQDFRFNMDPSMGNQQEPKSIDFTNQEFRLNNMRVLNNQMQPQQAQMNPSMIPQHLPMTQQQQLLSNGQGNLHASHMQQPTTSDQASQQHGQANQHANHPQKAMTSDQMIQQGPANQKQQSAPSNHGDKPKAVEDISKLIREMEKVNENEQKEVQAINADQSLREVETIPKSTRFSKKARTP